MAIEMPQIAAEGIKESAKESGEFTFKNDSEIGNNESEVFDGEIRENEMIDRVNVENINDESINEYDFQDSESIHWDNIDLQSSINEITHEESINDIREEYSNIDSVMSDIESVLSANPSELDLQRIDKKIETYKGTIFEAQIKEAMKEKFEEVEKTQRIVETKDGQTKPDVVLKNAKEGIDISATTVAKGEDLFIETKCGGKEYLQKEIQNGHIEKQVGGHEGNSLVIVTKDYLDLSDDIRQDFQKELKERESSVYVADVLAKDIETNIQGALNY